MKIGTGQLGQGGLWTTPIRRISDSAQRAARQPSATAFVTRNRSPPTRAESFPTSVDAATNRTGTGDDHQTRRSISRTVEGDIGIGDHFKFAHVESRQRLAHAFAQLSSPRPGEPDLCSNQIVAPQFRHRTSTIDRFAHSRGRAGDPDSQRVGWSSQAFTDHTEVGVHDHSFRFGATAVDTHHRILRVQPFSWREICCSSFSAHNGSYGGRIDQRLDVAWLIILGVVDLYSKVQDFIIPIMHLDMWSKAWKYDN